MQQRGAAAVEFALLLPLLLLVIAGIIDFGRLLYSQVILTNAVREGARVAVVMSPYDPTKVITRTQSAAGPLNDGTSLHVTPPPSCSAKTLVTVSATYDFNWLILKAAMNLFGTGDALPKEIASEAAMQCGG